MSISNAIQDGTLGTWVWYGRHRFSHWSGWLRPWNWVKFKRPKRGTYLWRLTVGPFELRRVRGLLGHLPRRQRLRHAWRSGGQVSRATYLSVYDFAALNPGRGSRDP